MGWVLLLSNSESERAHVGDGTLISLTDQTTRSAPPAPGLSD